MKRIISSLSALFVQGAAMLFMFALSMAGLMGEVLGLVKEKGAGWFAFAGFGALFLLLLLVTDRLVYVITYEDGKITRKGIFGGFHKECPVSSIQKVVIRYVWREGEYIYLVDDSSCHFDSARKDSYICFAKTKKNLAFVRTFWSGEIKENTFCD